MKLPAVLDVLFSIATCFAQQATIVDLGYAKYKGALNQQTGNIEFRGIRYAASPTGKYFSFFFTAHCQNSLVSQAHCAGVNLKLREYHLVFNWPISIPTSAGRLELEPSQRPHSPV
jgi:hypothetical protein